MALPGKGHAAGLQGWQTEAGHTRAAPARCLGTAVALLLTGCGGVLLASVCLVVQRGPGGPMRGWGEMREYEMAKGHGRGKKGLGYPGLDSGALEKL